MQFDKEIEQVSLNLILNHEIPQMVKAILNKNKNKRWGKGNAFQDFNLYSTVE